MIAQAINPAPPLERIFGIRDRFSSGGSTSGFFLVIAMIVIVFLLLVLFTMLARRWRRRKVYNPRSLFFEIMRQLQLTVPQRDLLRRVARDLKLEHPSILLLSPRIFHEYANAWMSASGSANLAMRERLDALTRVMYGSATSTEED